MSSTNFCIHILKVCDTITCFFKFLEFFKIRFGICPVIIILPFQIFSIILFIMSGNAIGCYSEYLNTRTDPLRTLTPHTPHCFRTPHVPYLNVAYPH